MASKSKSRSGLLVGAAYGVLAAGFLVAGVLPIVRSMSAANSDIRAAQAEIAARVAREKQFQDLQGQVSYLELQTRDFQRLVPQNQDLGLFVLQLYEKTNQAGMRDVVVRNFTSTPLGRSQKIPIEIQGKGTYAQFQEFLKGLESLQRLCSIGKLIIDTDSEMDGSVSVNVTLYIYSAKAS